MKKFLALLLAALMAFAAVSALAEPVDPAEAPAGDSQGAPADGDSQGAPADGDSQGAPADDDSQGAPAVEEPAEEEEDLSGIPSPTVIYDGTLLEGDGVKLADYDEDPQAKIEFKKTYKAILENGADFFTPPTKQRLGELLGTPLKIVLADMFILDISEWVAGPIKMAVRSEEMSVDPTKPVALVAVSTADFQLQKVIEAEVEADENGVPTVTFRISAEDMEELKAAGDYVAMIAVQPE